MIPPPKNEHIPVTNWLNKSTPKIGSIFDVKNDPINLNHHQNQQSRFDGCWGFQGTPGFDRKTWGFYHGDLLEVAIENMATKYRSVVNGIFHPYKIL